MTTEPENSLTLDMDARARAAKTLSERFDAHYCAEWDEGDGCRICWNLAADVIRAAEGLRECERCGGQGVVDGGWGTVSCCPECGGNGLDFDPKARSSEAPDDPCSASPMTTNQGTPEETA